MSKKRRPRKQKKKQRHTQKGKFKQQGRRGTAVLPSLALDADSIQAIAPLLTGSDAQSTKNITNAIYISGQWADEPELIEILFAPETSMIMLIKTAEGLGYEADSFFNLKGAAFEDAFFDIITIILPTLLTEEIRQEILAGLAELGQRYKKRRQRRKAAQVAFVRLMLSSEEQKETWPLIKLLQAIASRSINAGFKLVEVMEEIGDMGEDLFDEAGNLTKPAIDSRLTKLLEEFPGIDRFFNQQIDQLWDEAESAVYTGSLHLGLFTEAELEQADAILAKHWEPAHAAGREGIPDEIVPVMLQEIDDHLIRMLTPERLVQMQQRLAVVIGKKQIEPKWLGLASMLREYLKEEDAAETERPFLFRALIGELHVAAENKKDR